MSNALRSGSVVAVALGLAACSLYSGSSGSPPDAASGGPGGMVLGSLTDVCAGDPTLTGQNVLGALKASYAATFSPQQGTPSQLVLTTAYQRGTITCTPASTGGEVAQPAQISVVVHFGFATSDGMFHEAFDAFVTLASGNESVLVFAAVLPLSSLHGTYSPQISGTWSMHDVEFGGELFVGAAATGQTSGSVIEQAASGNMGQVVGAGSWQ